MLRKIIILLVALSIAGIAFAAAPRDVRLSISSGTQTTMTVNWTTDQVGTVGKVQYKKSSSTSYTTVTAAYYDYSELGTPVRLWTKKLTGLSAGTTYQYRVGDGTNWSAYYTFKTASATSNIYKFIVIGDSSSEDVAYSGDDNMLQENMATALATAPDAKFVIGTGDTVEQGLRYDHWAPWLSAMSAAATKMPIMLTVSKDDMNGGEDPVTEEDILGLPTLLAKMLPNTGNGPAGFENMAYSYTYRNAHIAHIPNQVSYHFEEEADQITMLQTIAAWLDADLAANASATWKIVVMHVDFFPTMSDRSALFQKSYIQPIIDKHNVDIVFDGHCHTIARTFPVSGHTFADSPADGTVYFTTGMSNSDGEEKEDVQKKIWHAFSFDPQTTANHMIVEVDNDELSITTYLADGTLVDVYEIDKGDYSECTPTVAPREYGATHMVVMGTLIGFWSPEVAEEYGEGMPFEDNIVEDEIPDLIPNGAWCFDARSLAVVINGKWFPEENMLRYDDQETELEFPADTVSACGNYVSEVGLEAVGFEAYYDEDANLWYIERYRD